jgi:undecaprenyl diphosphate synthase
MARQRSAKHDAGDTPVVALRHVLVVGGTVAEWDALGADRWAVRRSDLAKVVSHAGAMWLTIRPYSDGGVAAGAGEPDTQRLVDVREGCTVVVDPEPDGRTRFLEAVRQLQDSSVCDVDETVIANVLMAPAPVEPDLTVILGLSHHLPPSLVWELAYSEIVFIDVPWDELAAAHVERAIDEYSRRHRRFGGIE